MSRITSKKIRLQDCATIKRGVRVTKSQLSDNKKYPVYSGGVKPMGYFDDFNQEANVITVVKYGTAGYVNFIEQKFWANDVCYCIKPNKGINNKFLFYALKNLQNEIYSRVNIDAIPAHLTSVALGGIELYIPPLEVQKEIVRILDKFTTLHANLEVELRIEQEIRRKQYEYYLNKLLTFEERDFDGGGVIDMYIDYIQPTNYIVSSTKYNEKYPTPVLTAGKSFLLGYTDNNFGVFPASKENPVILFDDFTTSMQWVDFPFKVKSSALKILVPKSGNHSFRFLYYLLSSLDYKVQGNTHGRHWISKFSKIKISIPPIEVQNKICTTLDRFSDSVNSLTKALTEEIIIRQQQYEYYCNKLITFEEL